MKKNVIWEGNKWRQQQQQKGNKIPSNGKRHQKQHYYLGQMGPESQMGWVHHENNNTVGNLGQLEKNGD